MTEDKTKLVCPHCGKLCEHWRKEMPHEATKEVWEKNLKTEPDPVIKPKPEDPCSCGHPHHRHGTTGICFVGTCQCKNFQIKTTSEELLGEDGHPICACGHDFESHDPQTPADRTEETCWECWTDAEKPMPSVCRGYTPQTTPEVSEEFKDVNKEALKQIDEKKETKPVVSYAGGSYTGGDYYGHNYGSNTYTFKPKCVHKPAKVFEGEGWSIWVGQKAEAVNEGLLDFDLILNCANTGGVLPSHKMHGISWAKKFETIKTKEIELDWPDMGVPVMKLDFWGELLAYVEKNKQKLLIFCIGGHGRTGTALAALMVASGWEARKSKNGIWSHYCREAIETLSQEAYLDRIEKFYKDKAKKGAN